MKRGPRKTKTKPKTIVGKRLAIIREERKLTMRQMEDDLDVCHQVIYRWMATYEYPNALNIKNICKTYNVSADWLLGLSDRKEGPC